MAKSAKVSAPVKILSATQAASDIFKHPGGIGVFIGLRGHAGGEWSLFAEFPDETWVNVGSGCARAGINYLPAPTAAS